MATETIIRLKDDLDGSAKGVQTVRYSFNGIDYEIDLHKQNRMEFEEALAFWVKASRVVGPKRSRRRKGKQYPKGTKGLTVVAESDGTASAKSQPKPSLLSASAVREWAIERGFKLADRGRIPASVLAEYKSQVLGIGTVS